MFTIPPPSLTQLNRDPKDFLESPDPGMKHIQHCVRMAQGTINGEHSTLITTSGAARGSVAVWWHNTHPPRPATEELGSSTLVTRQISRKITVSIELYSWETYQQLFARVYNPNCDGLSREEVLPNKNNPLTLKHLYQILSHYFKTQESLAYSKEKLNILACPK